MVIWAAVTGIEEQGFLRLCRRFEREHAGITVQLVGSTNADKLIRAVVAGAPPDIVYLYGTSLVGPLAANGAIAMLDDRFRESGLHADDYLPGTIPQSSWNGKIYAMPVTRDSYAVYCNPQVLGECGFPTHRGPDTLEELELMAREITARNRDGSLRRIGVRLPDDHAVLMSAYGATLYDEAAGAITTDADESISALEGLIRLMDAQGGYSRVRAFSTGIGREASAQSPIASGKAAMYIGGEWNAMYLLRHSPETDYFVDKLPHPAKRPDLRNMAWQDGDVMMLPQGAKSPDAAWAFMRWMQRLPQQEEYAAAMSNLPAIKAGVHSLRITQGSKARETVGFILREVAAVSKCPRFFPTLPVTQLYRDTLQFAVQTAMLKQKTPQQALRDCRLRVQAELDKYRVHAP